MQLHDYDTVISISETSYCLLKDSRTQLVERNLGLQRNDRKICFKQSIQILYLIHVGIKHQQTLLLKPIPSQSLSLKFRIFYTAQNSNYLYPHSNTILSPLQKEAFNIFCMTLNFSLKIPKMRFLYWKNWLKRCLKKAFSSVFILLKLNTYGLYLVNH